MRWLLDDAKNEWNSLKILVAMKEYSDYIPTYCKLNMPGSLRHHHHPPFRLQAQDDPDPFGKALDLLSEFGPETSSPNAMDPDVIVEVEGAKAPVVKTAGTVTCEHCQVTWMKDEICRGWWGWSICCFWLRCLWLFLFLFSSSLLSSPSSSLTIQRSTITKTKEVSAVPVSRYL